jgi:NTE family protein
MVKKINLALQGGGAHGAFTWGVLDRILEDEDVEISAISGTSAGALNGSAFKAGMIEGGREGARDRLDWLWGKVGAQDQSLLSTWMQPFGMAATAAAIETMVPYFWADAMTRMVSPYAMGALYSNPLESIVSQLDFECIHAEGGPAPCLFVCATRVRNGKVRVFKDSEISTKAILASACLPTMFQAIELYDEQTDQVEAFWDGGYTGNPALFPLFHPSLPDDIVIININPLERDELPRTPHAIQNRINEISFNSSLLRELRAIEFVQRLLGQGTLSTQEKSRVLVHMISDDLLMNELSVATKVVPTFYTLAKLKDAGRTAADTFLNEHKKDLNERSSVDLTGMFN